MSDLPPTKRCLGPCQRDLPLTLVYYSVHAHGKYGFQARCRDCCLQAQKDFYKEHPERKAAKDKKWALANPDKVKANHARHRKTEKWKKTLQKNWLENKYGLTEEQYQELWDKQGGLCAICGKSEETTTRLHVDHDHETKIIRGLLCGKCNRGVGMFDDNKELLQKAIDYLTTVVEQDSCLKVKENFKP